MKEEDESLETSPPASGAVPESNPTHGARAFQTSREQAVRTELMSRGEKGSVHLFERREKEETPAVVYRLHLSPICARTPHKGGFDAN